MSALTIICIILSSLFIIIDLIKGEIGWVLIWIIILGLNIFTGINEIKKKEKKLNGDVETYVIHDVKGFKADTTTIINGTDTTKTYILTYWK